MSIHLKFSSAEKFRAKTGRTMMAMCEGKGISEFCCKGLCGRAKFSSRGSTCFAARALCGKETYLLT